MNPPASPRPPSGPASRAPDVDQMRAVVDLYNSGRLLDAAALAGTLTEQFPQHPFGSDRWSEMYQACLAQRGD